MEGEDMEDEEGYEDEYGEEEIDGNHSAWISLNWFNIYSWIIYLLLV